MKLKTDMMYLCGRDVVLLIITLLSMMTQISDSRSNNQTDTGHRNAKLLHRNYSYSKTTPHKNNSTDTIRKTKGIQRINATNVNSNISVTDSERQTQTTQSVPGRSEQGLPIALIISSPAVAVGVFIFICITYKVHSRQLDAQCKELASKVESGSSPITCVPSSPCRSTAQRLVVPGQLVPGHAVSDSDLIGQRRKSLRTPTPPPHGLSSKRGSCLSALSADQEVLARASPRRHSTFIL